MSPVFFIIILLYILIQIIIIIINAASDFCQLSWKLNVYVSTVDISSGFLIYTSVYSILPLSPQLFLLFLYVDIYILRASHRHIHI